MIVVVVVFFFFGIKGFSFTGTGEYPGSTTEVSAIGEDHSDPRRSVRRRFGVRSVPLFVEVSSLPHAIFEYSLDEILAVRSTTFVFRFHWSNGCASFARAGGLDEIFFSCVVHTLLGKNNFNIN